MSIHINSITRRQTPESQYSHFEGTDDELLRAIEINMESSKPGYRDGVILVPVAPYGFWTGLVRLRPGDRLTGSFHSRVVGEDPRKHICAKRSDTTKKLAAVAVDIVLYRHDVLAENNDHESDCDWEVVSINARPFLEELPIQPETLIANHFQLSGGTATNMSAEEFERELGKSVKAWGDLAYLSPHEKRSESIWQRVKNFFRNMKNNAYHHKSNS